MSDVVATLLFGEKKLEPVKVWIETALEPIWFGFWHRKVYIVRTDFMKMTFRYRDEAEEFAGLMRWHLTPH